MLGVTSLDDAMSSCAGSMVGNVGMVVGKGIGEHDCADDWVKDEPCLLVIPSAAAWAGAVVRGVVVDRGIEGKLGVDRDIATHNILVISYE